MDDHQVADEYETDSGDDFSDREDEEIAPVLVSRSGRPIRAHFRLDLQGTLIVNMFHVSQEKTSFVCYSLQTCAKKRKNPSAICLSLSRYILQIF